MEVAGRRALVADVRGLERLIENVQTRDRQMGTRRPDVVNGLIAAVLEQLDAARGLQLAREHWASRLPILRKYHQAIDLSLIRFGALKPWLEDIRSLAGLSQAGLKAVQQTAARILSAIRAVVPPAELETAHALLMSAANLADNAGAIRTRAVLEGRIGDAWDASAAAAGALLLGAQARAEIDAALSLPQLNR
jgi:hypothetical protein